MNKWRPENGIGRIDCDSASEFLEVLAITQADWGWIPHLRRASWIFRGHANSEWELNPTAWRQPPHPSIQQARSIVLERIPALTGVQQWDHTGGLPAPPTIDLRAAHEVIVQANAELLLLSEFINRLDELGIPIPGALPPRFGHFGPFEIQRPVAADDFLQLANLQDQVALAQHYGIPTRLLDWSDNALVAAHFAATAQSDSDRMCVWALNESQISQVGGALWSTVGVRIRIIRPPRSENSYLRAQRGAFTVPWGAGCYALINGGRFPSVENLAALAQPSPEAVEVLRCVTLPRALASDLTTALEQQWITLDTLMPSPTTVARTILGA